jgi:hypothetical protein
VQILSQLNYSIRQIARIVDKPTSFVQRWARRDIPIEAPHAGRPPKITRSTVSKILKQYRSKPRTSLRIVEAQMKVSKSSIQRILKSADQYLYHQVVAPKLTAEHKKARVRFAKENANVDWSKVFFVDEKIACIIPKPNRKNDAIWLPRGSEIPVFPRTAHPFQLNVSAGISVAG